MTRIKFLLLLLGLSAVAAGTILLTAAAAAQVVGGEGQANARTEADEVTMSVIVGRDGAAPANVFALGGEEIRQEPGAVIVGIVEDGPADQAGIRRGDILLEAEGERIDGEADLAAWLAQHEPGQAVDLRVRHGETERTVTVTLGGRDGIATLGLLTFGAGGPLPRLPGLPLALALAVDGSGSLVIEDVLEDTPAREAGLRRGERITAVDGVEVADLDALRVALEDHAPGDTVRLALASGDRDGDETRQLDVTLAAHPDDPERAYIGVVLGYPHRMLLQRQLVPEVLPRADGPWSLPDDVDAAVLVGRVVDGSPADEAGLMDGDRITAVDGEPVTEPDDLVERIRSAGPGARVVLTVARVGEDEQDLTVTLAGREDDDDAGYLGIDVIGFARKVGVGDGSPALWLQGARSAAGTLGDAFGVAVARITEPWRKAFDRDAGRLY